MASHRRIVRFSFLLCILGIFLMASSSIVSASFFKNGYYPQPYSNSIDTFPILKEFTAPGIVVTDSSESQYVVTSPGVSINISLIETDPYQDWIPVYMSGAINTRNYMLDSYPVKHIFECLVTGSSYVQFKLIDERTGKTAETFEFYLVVDEPTSGIGGHNFSEDTVPSFVWPPEEKF